MDSAEFGVVLWSHAAAIHRYLNRRCPSLADDLLSEVFVSAFVGRDGFDPSRGTFRAWLFGIARNTLATHFRNERARRTRPQRLTRDTWDEWLEVDARLDAAETVGSLRRCLAAMPAVEREVLLLVAWEELTPTEVAHVLSIPVGTARSRLHRARHRLADEPTLAGRSSLTPERRTGVAEDE